MVEAVERNAVSAQMMGDISSKAEIKETAYQLVSTADHTIGMVRGLANDKFDWNRDKD